MFPELVRLDTNTLNLIDRICLIEYASFSDYWTKENIIFEMSNLQSFSFALLFNKKIIGYIFSTKILDEIQINKFCIDLTMRNKGYGTKLLEKFIKTAKEENCKLLFLEVNVKNNVALQLYKKAGFIQNRIRPKIYNNTDDGIEMILYLAE